MDALILLGVVLLVVGGGRWLLKRYTPEVFD